MTQQIHRSDTLPKSHARDTGIAFVSGGGVFMDKPTLIEDLGFLYYNSNSKQTRHYGLFECPYCKKHFKTQLYQVKSGKSTSCGCYQKVQTSKARKTHGLAGTKIYSCWIDMKNRCYNPKVTRFENYGGRGITVCEEWKNSFETFRDWALANGYSERLQINRINNDGNYDPSNCNFVTQPENDRNRRMQRNNTSGYRGVTNHYSGKWTAYVVWNSTYYYLGTHVTKESAALAYNKFVTENKTGNILNVIPS